MEKSNGRLGLCGLAMSIAGLLFMSGVFHPNDDVNGVLSPAWMPVHVCAFIASVLVLYGLLGLYGRHGSTYGRLGFIGFVMAFSSGICLTGIALYEFTVLPILMADPAAQSLANFQTGPIMKGSFGMILFASFMAYFVGLIILGIDTMRARIVARGSVVLLLAGYAIKIAGIMVVLNVEPSGSFFDIANTLKNAGQIMLSLGYMWLGYSLWLTTRASA